jgi:hypothetical protein
LSEELSELVNQRLTSMREKAPVDSYDMFMQTTQTAVDRSIKKQYIAAEVRSITQSYTAKIETLLYTTLKTELSKKPLQRTPRTMTDVLDELTKEIAHVQLDVLGKIVETACRSFEDTFMDVANHLDVDSQLNSGSDSEMSTVSDLWSDLLKRRFPTLISQDVSRPFREPLVRLFDPYIRNFTVVSKESSVYPKVLDSDIAVKRERQTLEKVVRAKSQVQFLELEM